MGKTDPEIFRELRRELEKSEIKEDIIGWYVLEKLYLTEVSKKLEEKYGLVIPPHTISEKLRNWKIEIRSDGAQTLELKREREWERLLDDLIPFEEKILYWYVEEKRSPYWISRRLKDEPYNFNYSDHMIRKFLGYLGVELRGWKEGMDTQRVLSKKQESEIRRLSSEEGLSDGDLAYTFNVTKTTIRRVKK